MADPFPELSPDETMLVACCADPISGTSSRVWSKARRLRLAGKGFFTGFGATTTFLRLTVLVTADRRPGVTVTEERRSVLSVFVLAEVVSAMKSCGARMNCEGDARVVHSGRGHQKCRDPFVPEPPAYATDVEIPLYSSEVE